MKSRKNTKIAKDVANKKQYLDYYKMMMRSGKQPMTLANWDKEGKEPVYFKGITKTRAEAKLPRRNRKRLGLSD